MQIPHKKRPLEESRIGVTHYLATALWMWPVAEGLFFNKDNHPHQKLVIRVCVCVWVTYEKSNGGKQNAKPEGPIILFYQKLDTRGIDMSEFSDLSSATLPTHRSTIRVFALSQVWRYFEWHSATSPWPNTIPSN